MRILKWLIHQKILMSVTVLFIIGIGIYSFSQLDTELTPEVGMDSASIEVETNNISIADIEKQITIPLEKEFETIANVEDIVSTTSTNSSSIQLRFHDGKGDETIQEVRSKVPFVLRNTSNIENVAVQQDGATTASEFILDLSGGKMSKMTDFAKNTLQPKLEKLPEVRNVSITGIEKEKIIIKLNNNSLKEHNLTTEDVSQTIHQLNQKENLNHLTENEKTNTLYWDTTLDDMEAIISLSIPTEQGIITLDELAEITLDAEETFSDTWKDDSSDVLMIQIAREENASQKDMTAAVRDEISQMKSAGLINDMTLNEVIAHSDFVNDAMSDVIKNIIIGGIIAVIVLLLFLQNIRATIIIGISIPTSILLTIITMGILDYSLNLLTLIGLGLGIGMMVDASIVILESIYSKKEAGFNSIDAVVAGTREVASAITASALTTIVVFLPIGFVGGDSGKYMLMLALVIAITLISSVAIAFTLIPTLTKDFLHYKKRKKNKNSGQIIIFYKKILTWCVETKRRSLLVVFTFILLFGSVFLLIPKIPMNIMPDIFNRYTEVAIDLENGVTNEQKYKVIEQANERLQKIEDIDANFLLIQDDKIMASIVMTKDDSITEEQGVVTENIIRTLRDLQKSTPIRSVQRALDGSNGYPIHLQIAGEDMKELTEATANLQKDIEQIEGVVDVTTDLENYSDIETITLNEDAMDKAEITENEIKEKITASSFAEPITAVDWNNKTIPIYLKQKTTSDLLKEKIITTDGEAKLSKFISIETDKIPEQITRTNEERYLSLMADIEDQDLGTVNQELKEVISNFNNGSNYTVSLAGELEEQDELINDTLFAMIIAIILVYVVMAVQFNHFGHPFIVMATLPATVIGVFLGLFITQTELNMMSGMGMIILIGIVLNNAILLIDRTNQLQKDGKSIIPALIQAGENRIRPIFMTTLTTIGGMLPLALATGMSADYQAPMAIVIISGLLFSTMITLILIPAIYRLCIWK